MVMICGIATFGLWTGILATGFANESRRRNFIETWDLVSKVPFFQTLDPTAITEITHMLRRVEVPERTAVIRRGRVGDCMYFIAAGEVEVDIEPTPVRLGVGAFFGELALLGDSIRTANVATTKPSTLLILDLADFRKLMAHYAEARPCHRCRRQTAAERQSAAPARSAFARRAFVNFHARQCSAHSRASGKPTERAKRWVPASAGTSGLKSPRSSSKTARMTATNETHDPARRSFVETANAPDSDFPIQNLPFGVFRPVGGRKSASRRGDRRSDPRRRRGIARLSQRRGALPRAGLRRADPQSR